MIAIKCGYKCYDIKEKYARRKIDCYRFSISSSSYDKLYTDIIDLSKSSPTCNLVHKMERLEKQVKSKKLKIVAISSVP